MNADIRGFRLQPEEAVAGAKAPHYCLNVGYA
jgi:hypothetical protein